MIEQIRRLARNTCFDELPCTEINSEAIDFRAASEFFSKMSRQLTSPRMKTLGLLKDFRGREVPTQGAVLLFGKTFFLMRSFGARGSVVETQPVL